jgi:hypothetical protein
MKLSRIGRLAALTTAVVFVFAGCGGQSQVAPTSAMTDATSPSHGKSWMSAKANFHHPWLYVSDTANSVVYIYDLGKTGIPLIGKIADGLNGPFGLTVDSSGRLYVSNQGTPGNVVVYAAGATSPSLTLSDDLMTPQGVAVDSSGNVWVMNRSGSPGIAVFPPGGTEPSEYITNQLIQNPIQDFFDREGNLFFSDPVTGVSEIPAGSSQQPVSLNLQGLNHADGITLAPSTHFYVGDWRGNRHYVTHVYALGSTQPKYDLKGKVASYYLANGMIGYRDVVFAPDWWSNRVFLYRDGSRKWISVIDAPGSNDQMGGVAYKPANIP